MVKVLNPTGKKAVKMKRSKSGQWVRKEKRRAQPKRRRNKNPLTGELLMVANSGKKKKKSKKRKNPGTNPRKGKRSKSRGVARRGLGGMLRNFNVSQIAFGAAGFVGSLLIPKMIPQLAGLGRIGRYAAMGGVGLIVRGVGGGLIGRGNANSVFVGSMIAVGVTLINDYVLPGKVSAGMQGIGQELEEQLLLESIQPEPEIGRITNEELLGRIVEEPGIQNIDPDMVPGEADLRTA